MAAEESSGGASDPYATSKANLRDTVKWLAAIFAGLAAVVIAGTPVSGIGSPSLSLARTITGIVVLLLAFAQICIALIIILRLLRSDLLYPSDLDPRIDTKGRKDAEEINKIRSEIEAHRLDLIPDYASYTDFLVKKGAVNQAALKERSKWAELLDSHATQAAIDAAKATFDVQLGELRSFEAVEASTLDFASYLRFYNRLRSATVPLFGLGIGALLALLVFAFAVQSPKEDKAPMVAVVPIFPPGPAASAPASVQSAPALIGTLLFDLGSAILTAEAKETLTRARNLLTAQPDASLLVVARTDTAGRRKINDSLAHERAVAIRSMLLGAGGVAGARVFVAELPKSDLPKMTSESTALDENRSASLYLIRLQR